MASSIANRTKQVKVQMKRQVFDSYDPNSIFNLLSPITMAYDTNDAGDRTAQACYIFFKKSTAGAVVKPDIAVRAESHKGQKAEQ